MLLATNQLFHKQHYCLGDEWFYIYELIEDHHNLFISILYNMCLQIFLCL